MARIVVTNPPPESLTTDPFQLAQAAAHEIARRTGVARHDAFVILGSGFAAAADWLGDATASVPFSELPGFPRGLNAMHVQTIRSVNVGGLEVLVLLGRAHLYEGFSAGEVVHGVRAAALSGCRTAIINNICGSLRPEWTAGQQVLIKDHINFSGRSPLVGPPPPAPHKGWFQDLTEAYSVRLRALAQEIQPGLPEGIYGGWLGPQFETPAEIRMMRTLGCDLVGMSTVMEVIAARHMGLETLALSVVGNLAAGLGPKLDSPEVQIEATRAVPPLGDLLLRLLERLARDHASEVSTNEPGGGLNA